MDHPKTKTGRELYDRYSYEQAQRGVEIEEWEDLTEHEEGVWNALAEWATNQERDDV